MPNPSVIPRGVRVNAVGLGPISTPLYEEPGLAKADLKAMSDSLKGQIPARIRRSR